MPASSRSLAAPLATALALALLGYSMPSWAQTLSNSTFNVQFGSYGQINSLQLTGDAFPTNYVLNGSNGPAGFSTSSDHEWVGELMFKYRLSTGVWNTALTSQSGDARSVASTSSSVTVTYQNSASAQGVKNFKLVEAYSLVGNALVWQITLTNTSSQTVEFGDVGLPLPFNEYWGGGDVIYETRTVYHSFIGQNSSYVTVKRPSGVGPFLLLVPDPTTGAGFEYKDHWTKEDHPGTVWAEGSGNPWPTGLEVYYIHSNVIKSDNQGYLPSTSLTLAPNQSQTYGFKFFSVADQNAVQDTLYAQGLVDVSVVPSLMLATNMTAKIDLHTSKAIHSLTAQYPGTTITSLGTVATDHNIYQVNFTQLGANAVTVSYGTGETTTLQFCVLEPIDAAIQRHATFMVQNTQWSSGDLNHMLDDWMMDSRTKRGATGGWGWGDDWGWTKGEFLAEKNAQTPVASEVAALDNYLDAVWARAIDPNSYVVQDWWCPAGTSATNINNCFYDRAYAYPHAFNTYFSMYKVASLYPGLVSYHQSADTYLMRAYNILHALYTNTAIYGLSDAGAAGTGYMGEQTLPEIAQALTAAGHGAEGQTVTGLLGQIYQAFKANPYPYGSEYTYDNTGEEAVYTAAKASGDTAILAKVNAKTRACRGQEPVWYWYADPVSINGEGWWQFQYTAALAGYCMDDWVRSYSTTPEIDERLSYAAKIANVSAINSGQIDSNAQNLGTVSWTYQAMKGNAYRGSAETVNGQTASLHNGWRAMSGEADLGLFGAIRILSSDVVIDPVFGLYGYGCNVTESSGCYAVTPLDGVFKRLNLISQKFHMDLDRDRYAGATVSASSDYLGFTLENQTPSAAHATNVTILGLTAGSYPVSVDGASVATAVATSGKPTVVSVAVGTHASYSVQIGTGCGGATTGSDGGDGALPDGSTLGPDAGLDATVGDASSGGTSSGSSAGSGSGTSSGGQSSGGASGAGIPGASSGCGCRSAGAATLGRGATEVACLAGIALGLARRRRRGSSSAGSVDPR